VAVAGGDDNDIDDGAERRVRALREREAESVHFLLNFSFLFLIRKKNDSTCGY
jgi:hypothetical protein